MPGLPPGKRNPRSPAPSRWPVPKVHADGWSEWVQPQMHGYQMKCCGCGLIHEVDFRVYRVDEKGKGGTFGPVLPITDYKVQMRLKRV